MPGIRKAAVKNIAELIEKNDIICLCLIKTIKEIMASAIPIDIPNFFKESLQGVNLSIIFNPTRILPANEYLF